MNKRPTFVERYLEFINGKGFYLLVLLCVAVIGGSAFFLLRSAGEGGQELPVSGTAAVTVTPAPEQSASPTPAQKKESPSPAVISAPPADTLPVKETPALAEPEPAAPVWVWPVEGELLADFSLETLAYDETMGDWRTHCGIDIAADRGCNVVCVAGGQVSQVFQDDLMGWTVVVDHGEGLVSTYANLQADPPAAPGDRVYAGSIIGVVGSTAIAESGRASHLHFELAREGMAVDPENYLPAQ